MKKEIKSTKAPSSIGPYSLGIESNGFIFLSGQIPVNPKTGEIPMGINEQTKQVLSNIDGVLLDLGLNKNNIVKTTVFMTNLKEFDELNEVYGNYFVSPFPARSCIEISQLPKGVKVEIECIIEK